MEKNLLHYYGDTQIEMWENDIVKAGVDGKNLGQYGERDPYILASQLNLLSVFLPMYQTCKSDILEVSIQISPTRLNL